MSETVKKTRKSKETYIQEAIDAGLGEREILESMSVPEIKKLFTQDEPKDEKEPYKYEPPVCEHDYFRKIRIVDQAGNYVVQVCKHCGHKDRI